MLTRFLFTAALAASMAVPASASSLVIRNIRVDAISGPDQPSRHQAGPMARAAADTPPAAPATSADYAAMPELDVYPVAGNVGADLFIPYFVDLDPTPGAIRDFSCGRMTFDDHTGHDAYVRSFREQDIGVPIFAPLDGVVTDVRDGEEDKNTDANATTPANFIRLDHGSGVRSLYLHLKKGSITVKTGDKVVAGQQIGMVGSSGPSVAPHAHIEFTIDGRVVEPFSGPCRAGRSLMESSASMPSVPIAIGAALGRESFLSSRTPPYDDTTRAGTFIPGQQKLYAKVDVANLGPSTTYTFSLRSPQGNVVQTSTNVSGPFRAYLTSIRADLDAQLSNVGQWTLSLDVDGQRVADMPFLVVASTQQMSNRAPAALTASLEPVGLLPGEVPVCRVSNPLIADPDYDIVTYRYEWTVNGQVVRTATTAARSDALPRNVANAAASIGCTVTATDGSASTSAATASTVVQSVRRRSVRR